MHRFCQALRTLFLSAALCLLCAAAVSAADLGVGTVNSSGLRLRSQPGTDATVLATASAGERAIVMEDAGEGWYKVDYKSIEGYMSAQYLDLAEVVEAELGYGLVTSEGATLNVRSGPGTEYDKVGVLNDGTVVTLLGMDKGWFKLSYNGVEGYASSDYLVTCLDAAGNRGDAVAAATGLGGQIVAYAKQYLGKPYVWGGNGPNSFDCSGFTKFVYSHFGYNLNRTASGQLSNGTAVSRDQLRAGDLVFFYNGKVSTPVSHVGIYIGDGNFIHASSNSYTVEISSLYARNYAQKYVYARRIAG